VRPDLELVARGLVRVRAAQHVETFDARRQRHRPPHDGTRALGRIHDLYRRIDEPAVVDRVPSKPASITPHTKFECEVYVLSKEEGGRHTPFFPGYRPQFYFRTTDVTGSCELPAGTEMVMPGDNIKMVVTLIAPIAMEQGLRFAIREGGKTVGAGVVTKVIE